MAAKATTSPAPRIIRLPEVVDRIGMSRGSVYRLMTLGRFPKSVKLSERAVGWRESDLDAWLESREHAA
ncbi:MAG: AlpA family transcriptional regulator [Chromatiales bacterium]|nr:AlpA family transcriptional regulator [Chromatiales bacterium]